MTEQEVFYNEILTDLENGTLTLPTLPEVALRVREVVDDPEATAADLAQIIVTDVALSARLLKVSNSPLYRGRVPIDNVQMAISRLGQTLVRNLVISLVMAQMFQATSSRLDKRLHDLWEHSTEVAAISQVLASKQPGIASEDALLAGLIHDIGVLPILMKADEDPDLLSDTVTLDSVISNLHTRVGQAILKSWGLSDALIDVAAYHEDLSRDSGEQPDLVDIVQVANLQSYMNTEHALSEEELEKVPAFKKLGVDTGISVVELDENSDEYAEALALFGL
ncbi:MAG: HDOD domain-containing protein [Gammaproteobacteria bacterium]|nr:HDOD domain-containing protein [Gammaproteobacteria bacterium]MDH5592655.1 HDOD domain-containing protein [Gammaproteobacteria bacterium]